MAISLSKAEQVISKGGFLFPQAHADLTRRLKQELAAVGDKTQDADKHKAIAERIREVLSASERNQRKSATKRQ